MRNRGDLAEGWYDPATKRRAEESASTRRSEAQSPPRLRKDSPDYGEQTLRRSANNGDSGGDDDYGPMLPTKAPRNRYPGPVIPNLEELEYRRGIYVF